MTTTANPDLATALSTYSDRFHAARNENTTYEVKNSRGRTVRTFTDYRKAQAYLVRKQATAEKRDAKRHPTQGPVGEHRRKAPQRKRQPKTRWYITWHATPVRHHPLMHPQQHLDLIPVVGPRWPGDQTA